MESRIILASSSPRRIEIMRNAGIEPIIMPSLADESLPYEVSMEQAVMFLALKKALNVEKAWRNSPAFDHVPTVIIAADTIVYKDGMIGKPASVEDAVNTLKRLRNTSHYVATGVAFISPGAPKRTVFYDVTEVFFKDYSDEDILRYVATDEPWDKAGGYAIQGAWGEYVSHIRGNYDNVIGFPWSAIQSELKQHWPEIKF